MPVLSSLVDSTNGPILELGVGFCSTPYLHWACYSTKRRLVSYEDNPDYYAFAKSWEDDFHIIHCITDWDSIDLSEQWTIAFIDHNNHRRWREALKLRHSEYVVIHDTENANDRKYRMSRAARYYKYRYKYEKAFPHTSVWSNKHDLSTFTVK